MKILSTLAKLVICCCAWAGLFLVCRASVWMLGKPAWWSLPAALIIGLAILIAGKLLHAAFRRKHTIHASPSQANASTQPAPRTSIRFRRAWERGRPYRKGRLFPPTPQPPWYICLNLPGSLPGHLPELADAAGEDTADYGDAFTWRRGPHAAWLDFPGSGMDDDHWRSFIGMIGGIPQFTPPAGIVVRLDCARILNSTHTSIHDDAPVMRRRLQLLQKACRKQLPFYLVVDNVDRLYGLRSIMSKAERDKQVVALGKIRFDRRGDSAAFVSSCLEDCLTGVAYPGPDAGPAALQARDEIRRLETPLIALLAQLTPTGAKGPFLRGLFLAAAAPGGEMVQPLLSRLPTFQPMDETLPVQPWFLRQLMRDAIPADAEAARNAATSPIRFAYPASAAGLLVGCLALCLFMTCSFFESRGVLLSARGRTAPPSSPENLQPYLDLADITRLRNNGWRLPRFGMNEPEALEDVLQRRFTDSYFDLKTIPGVEHVQDAAVAAALSADPGVIGNALLQLAVTRDGIGRNLERFGDDEKSSRFLQALVKALHLASDEDMRQLERYFAWAGQREWMPETHATLIDFEKYLIDHAGGGDLAWLPGWVGRLPGLRAIDTSRVWDAPADTERERSRIGPEWTLDGYRIACGLLSAVRYDSANNDGAETEWVKKRERALEMYRLGALERWRSAASVLWSGFRSRVPDAKVGSLFGDAADGDDPAGRFLRLVEQELLPMFDDVGEEAHPDLRWLRLRVGLLRPSRTGRADPEKRFGVLAERLAGVVLELGSDDGMTRLSRRVRAEPIDAFAAEAEKEWSNTLRQAGLAAMDPEGNLESVRSQYLAWRNPGHVNFSGQRCALRDAAEPAGRVHAFLFEKTGSTAWDGLSPLAVLDYARYLATRQAALKLNALWREKVYQPIQLTAGGDRERLARLTAPEGPLAKFLKGEATGFWQWNGRRLVNAEWNRLEFMFDQEFLDFCSSALREGAGAVERAVGAELSFDAVHVDDGARERPVGVKLAFVSGEGRREIQFRNYRLRETIDWVFDDGARVEVAVEFPSLTASTKLEGEGLAGFFRGLGEGEVVFGRECFAEAEQALGRMGIERVTVKAKLENEGNAFAKGGWMQGKMRAGRIPESVICAGAAADPGTAMAVAEYGPFSTIGQND